MKRTSPDKWKPIPGYAPYEASADGRIRNGENGDELRTDRTDANGYPVVGLKPTSAKPYRGSQQVHRLVALAHLVGTPLYCRHLDGDKTNNHISNLAWGTRSQNERDKIAHGTSNRQLTPEQVQEIRDTPATYGSGRRLARKFGVAPSTISAVRSGQNWNT